MLRILINILRPTEAQLRKRKPSFSLRMKMWLHRCMVKMLMHFYWRYAVHDILNLRDGTKVEIETRDLGFEKEVACAKLETKLHLQPLRELPRKAKEQKEGYRWFYRCFDWQRKVTVYNSSGRSVVIDHTSRPVLSGDLRVAAYQAKPDAMINTVKLSFSAGARRVATPVELPEEPEGPSRPRQTPPGRRRRVPPPSKIPGTVVPSDSTEPSPATQDVQPGERPHRTAPPNVLPQEPTLLPDTDEPDNPVVTPPRPLKRMRGFDLDDSF